LALEAKSLALALALRVVALTPSLAVPLAENFFEFSRNKCGVLCVFSLKTIIIAAKNREQAWVNRPPGGLETYNKRE